MGIFGSTVTLTSGEEVVADEEYLRESITRPALRVVDGFSPLMPSFSNQLTEKDVMDLVAYIKSLSAEDGAE
jgi:cytochrome c oxidase subunit 2